MRSRQLASVSHGGHAYHTWEHLTSDRGDVLHRCTRCGVYRVSDQRSMTFFSPDQRDVLGRVRFNRGGVPRCIKWTVKEA